MPFWVPPQKKPKQNTDKTDTTPTIWLQPEDQVGVAEALRPSAGRWGACATAFLFCFVFVTTIASED